MWKLTKKKVKRGQIVVRILSNHNHLVTLPTELIHGYPAAWQNTSMLQGTFRSYTLEAAISVSGKMLKGRKRFSLTRNSPEAFQLF